MQLIDIKVGCVCFTIELLKVVRLFFCQEEETAEKQQAHYQDEQATNKWAMNYSAWLFKESTKVYEKPVFQK